MTERVIEEEVSFPPEGGCFGCSTANDAGLKLPFVRRGDVLLSFYAIPDRFHGAPGISHGGIVATIFDEVSCASVFFVKNRYVVTGELSVRYEQPCLVETEIEFSARIVDDSHAKYAVVEGTAKDRQTVVARCRGKFFYAEREVSAP
jgi:acyl-coenzyme A thioesterase PaaI-like protein